MLSAYTTHLEGDLAHFDEEESRHVLQVLRRRVGDEIVWTDGRGNRYRGVIETAKKRTFTARVTEQEHRPRRRDYRIHLAVAPTKNTSRYEWFLEKATEIGIDRITPLDCEHSERTRIRTDRLRRILLSATKQSLSTYLPALDELTSFEDFLQQLPDVPQRFIAHCAPGERMPLKDFDPKRGDVFLLIGPEGDFSPTEIELATAAGFRAVSLGNSRLRTETAAVVGVTLLNFA